MLNIGHDSPDDFKASHLYQGYRVDYSSIWSAQANRQYLVRSYTVATWLHVTLPKVKTAPVTMTSLRLQ